jgi:hypothetical protein
MYRAELLIALLCPKLGRAMPRAGVVKLRDEKLPALIVRAEVLLRMLPMLRAMLPPPRDMPPNDPPLPACAGNVRPRTAAVATAVIRIRFVD